MKNILKPVGIVLLILTAFSWTVRSQGTFYNIDDIQEIQIQFSQSDWDYRLDTAKAGSGSYLMAVWVKVNGVQFDSAGVKYKGSSSYDPDFAKNPLHISLDEFKSQNYQGYTSIKLSNGYSDPSMIREVLAYDILKNYTDCPLSNFARVTVNGVFLGLYANDESVNKKFCSNHFYSSDNTFIKGNPALPGPFSKSNLKYISSDSSDYFSHYGLESDHGWNDLVNLCDAVDNQTSSINMVLDIDRALWMLAFNNLVVGLDSYSGWFSQNYYLYRDNDGFYLPVIWDLNMAFGGFPFAGTQGGGSGSLTVSDMQQLNPLLHANESDWPLIRDLMADPSYQKMYFTHMRTLINENFSNGAYQEKAQMLQGIIDASVLEDPNKFFTYQQFQQGLTGDVPFGSYVVPGIANLMDARTPFLLASSGLVAVPPVITNVVPDTPNPDINSTVTINAAITGLGDQGSVLMGIRFDPSKRFSGVLMYDDGNHNDGASGDGVFGAFVVMSAPVAQYYVYAENSLVGAFSPERAEFEFYSLNANIQTAQPGQVYINEFLAKNNTDTVNEYGNHEDWIELYNMTDEALDLFGLYLTDDVTNPAKYTFPENTLIQPGGFLIIWADEKDTVSEYLHCNFKLSANGEFLMLSDGQGLVLDSLTFGPQTADVSLGRCPNGNGPFISLLSTTFNYENNCPEAVGEIAHGLIDVDVFPNPARDYITFRSDDPGVSYVTITDLSGKSVITEKFDHGNLQIPTFTMPCGLYFYSILDEKRCALLRGKFAVVK